MQVHESNYVRHRYTSQPWARISVSALLAVASLGFMGSAWASESPAEVTAELADLNSEFREWYGAGRAELIEDLPLVLIVSNQGVIAIRQSSTANYQVDLTAYTQVKSVLHAALGFQGLMRTTLEAGESADWAEIEHLIQSLDQGRALIPSTELPSNLQVQVVGAYDRMIATAQKAVETRSVSSTEIRQTLQSVEELIYPSVLWIGQKHAKNIKSVLQTAKKDSTGNEWKQAVAVVTGPMTARRDNLETAVTARVLGPEKLGSRIFYAEGVFSTNGALSYLSTVLGDAQFSQDMFDSSTRMWRDLFSDTSRLYVESDFYTSLLP